MTTSELEALFEKYMGSDYIKFDRVPEERKRSTRPDLHAFLLLDSLVPGNRDMVSNAEHDEIYLEVKSEELAAVATEENILELVRCGVRFSGEFDCLAMFV